MIYHPSRQAPPYRIKATVETECPYPLLLSHKTWEYIEEHFGDTISEEWDERASVAEGELRMSACVKVRLPMSDGSYAQAAMDALKSDKDVLGLLGMLSLGLLVDAPRKCLKRAIMLPGLAGANPNFKYSQIPRITEPSGTQVQCKGSPSPPQELLGNEDMI